LGAVVEASAGWQGRLRCTKVMFTVEDSPQLTAGNPNFLIDMGVELCIRICNKMCIKYFLQLNAQTIQSERRGKEP